MPVSESPKVKISFFNEVFWAIAGVFLTVLGTFLEASTPHNPPWQWSQQGILLQPLGTTYQIPAVFLTACMGGKNAGAMSQIAYLFLGLYKLPVFAGGGGTEYTTDPGFGYILGFIPAAWVCGWFAMRLGNNIEELAFSSLCGLGVIHLVGLTYLGILCLFHPFYPQLSALEQLQGLASQYTFYVLPGQLVMICVVALMTWLLRKVLMY